MCRLRFLEIYLNLSRTMGHGFNILNFLMGSLSISLTSSEHLKLNIRFRTDIPFDPYTFYGYLRSVWRPLDSFTTDPTRSRLQRVDININYVCLVKYAWVEEPDNNEISKAVLDGLPLLRSKGILFVKAVLGIDVAWTAVG